MSKHKTLDIIINNAGIYKTANSVTEDGLDVRFVAQTASSTWWVVVVKKWQVSALR